MMTQKPSDGLSQRGYADDARLDIVNTAVPQASPFELCGKAEIAKHLWAAFGKGASHRIERAEVVG